MDYDALCERLDHNYARHDALCGYAAAAIRELRAEVERLHKDAERYRLIREVWPITVTQALGDEQSGFRSTYKDEQLALDSYIDAALAGKEQ